MTTTPVAKSKLSFKLKARDESGRSTPNKECRDLDNDYSPIYFPMTQESNEEIDVLWDWHSPQSSHRKRRKQKLLLPAQSPKYPLKRHPSNSNNQNFEKLRNELKALQEELAAPDESLLCVSPQQELEFKDTDLGFEPESQPICDEFNDLFDDSLDEQLIIFSQQIENEKKLSPPKKCDTSIDTLIEKYSEKNLTSPTSLNELQKTTVNLRTKVSFQRTFSADKITTQTNVIETVSGKLEFHRTKSFELAGLSTQNKVSRSVMEEIERKRLEAKAKLEAKKKNKSPNTCSLEEIEKKRQQALAKLENKRLQEMVEKKRQEALKKLQENRKKNASQVKSTLTTRL